jgi:hypothetical protein
MVPNTSTLPTGKVSAKFAPTKTWRRAIRIEQLARLCVTGLYSNEEMANHLGVNKQTVIILKQTKEFQSKMCELSTGVVSSYDKDLREDMDNAKAELRAMVPTALLQLRTMLLSKDERVKMKAVTEIMDREGTLSRVSRTSVSLENKPDLTQAARTGQDLLALLQSARSTPELEQTGISHSSFTVNAGEATAQAKMMRDSLDAKDLEDIDASELPVN